MATITTANINTGGATIYIGGTVNTADTDGYYIGTTGGAEVGATTGGCTVNYTFETSDIFCDQLMAPIDVAITSESATIEFEMLETSAANLQLALSQTVSETDAGVAEKIGVGGIRNVVYSPIKLTIPDTQSGLLTTWTFFRCKAGAFSTSFNRDTPTTVKCTFTAYADTTHASGHQLFSVNQALA